MGKALVEDWLAAADVLAAFGPELGPACRAYARFVADSDGMDLMNDVTAQVFLCDEAFIAKAMKHAKGVLSEVPKRHRAWKSLAAYEREATDRNGAIRTAYASTTCSLQAIGDHFGLHYATMTRLVRVGDVDEILRERLPAASGDYVHKGIANPALHRLQKANLLYSCPFLIIFSVIY